MVYYHIGITLVAGSKYYNIEQIRHFLKDFLCVLPNIYASFGGVPVGEGNVEQNIMWNVYGLVTMNKCLIEIEH